ncbi:MAG TPA: ATP synthase F1 subunit gamma [Vicinamibacterales bacterium]|nr:ATP synthase F1 subunit gamma [Vicinamibacterales bacterium]
MPSLIDMRRRIRAVKSTQQITKAMKMVAASKLRRAQERVIATRPFAIEARHVLKSIASRVDPRQHDLFIPRDPDPKRATMLIAITADRGLCGSFNANVIKAVSHYLGEHAGHPITLGLVGRRGRDFLGKRGLPVRFEYVNLPKVIRMAEAEAIAQPAVEDYVAGKIDRVLLIYNEFKSVIQQKLVVEQLLPVRDLDPGQDGKKDETPSAEYIYEPSPERILEILVKQLIVAQVLRALVESNAAFYAAQMTAMDSATRNSTEILESLTLYMNKLRQAAITREIIEVVSGAQAL